MLQVTNHLNLEIETENCQLPEDVRSRLQPPLDRLDASVHDLGNCTLWLKIVFHSKSEIHHAQGKLKLPGKTIITGAHAQYLDKAMLRCLEIRLNLEDHTWSFSTVPGKRRAATAAGEASHQSSAHRSGKAIVIS